MTGQDWAFARVVAAREATEPRTVLGVKIILGGLPGILLRFCSLKIGMAGMGGRGKPGGVPENGGGASLRAHLIEKLGIGTKYGAE